MIFILFERQLFVVYVAFYLIKNPLNGSKVTVFLLQPLQIFSNFKGKIFWGGFRG